MGKFVLLERGKHYTLTALADHLNTIYGSKKSQEKYSAIDIQKYLTRGHLPEYLGGFRLEEFRDDRMGIKMVEIKDEVHPTFLKGGPSDK